MPTYADNVMNGAPMTDPETIPWATRSGPGSLSLEVRPWQAGVYFVRLDADDGRIGFAPFVVRRADLGRAEPSRRRATDEHVAGLQLPRRGR